MAWDPRFADFVRELLEDLGDLRISRMFGGAGVYRDGLMFGLIVDDVLYLRADDENRQALIDAGSRQFTYGTRAGEVKSIGYWSLPDSAADDPEEATAWARRSLDAAVRKAAQQPARKRR